MYVYIYIYIEREREGSKEKPRPPASNAGRLISTLRISVSRPFEAILLRVYRLGLPLPTKKIGLESNPEKSWILAWKMAAASWGGGKSGYMYMLYHSL